MLELGGLAFTTPWLLAALVTLPVLWWLLRAMPPAPRLVSFPPIRLILALRSNEETPDRTPWWLILLRMILAAMIIVALAHPLLNPAAKLGGSGPLVVVVDDGWASAADWQVREQKIAELVDQADRESRPVLILPTAPSSPGEPIQISKMMRASEARQHIAALAPKPWPSDRAQALKALDTVRFDGAANIFWIADGIGDSNVAPLASRLQQIGGVTLIEQPARARARLILPPSSEGDSFSVPIARVPSGSEQTVQVRAMSDDGRLIALETASFDANASEATAILDLPGELRNNVARIEIENGRNAGEVFLMDERWRRRPVGLVSGDVSEAEQPLLSSLYYLERALRPFAEVRRGSVTELFKRELAIVILADVGKLLESEISSLQDWMEKGGVVLRFAGPKLASSTDELIPVRLRGGGRELGGAMSWTEPARLLPFEEASPFSGLEITPEVRINRQVLADPSLDLNQKTWARLSDGTPLVTAEKRGRGWIVLVHTTANTDWSNLPLSGLFVDMLRRVVGLSAGVVSGDSATVLPPLRTMDGYGRLGAPTSDTVAIPAREFANARPNPETPPGYYGRDNGRRALNISAALSTLTPMGELPQGVARSGFVKAPQVDFKPWLLLGALMLALVDLVVSLFLRGLFGPRGRGPATASIAILAGFLVAGMPGSADAQSAAIVQTGSDARAVSATTSTRLAFVVTGDQSLDDMTSAGLRGLSNMLRRRTAVEPGNPIGVDIEADELAFFPLLYWALSPRQPLLSEKARGKLNHYLKTGGTILFDTRERGGFSSDASGGVGEAGFHLRRLLEGLDVPALSQTPPDHVLTKAFYLLNDFPGRWTGGPLWVERRGGRHNDGVSSVIIGTNDFAGAWAVDELGRPLAAVLPGGERQREMAYRFGVNWVMYALTGNYKTDQVHVPAIIERLGN